jgi:hypothetical protein
MTGDNPEEQAHRYPLKKRLHASVARYRFDQGVSPDQGALLLEVLSGVQGRSGDGGRHPVPISPRLHLPVQQRPVPHRWLLVRVGYRTSRGGIPAPGQ